MKRTIAILLAVLMTVTAITVFSGCGSGQTPDTEESTPEQSTEEITENTEIPETSEESTEGTKSEDKPAAASSFRACSIKTNSLGELKYWLYTPSDPTENMPLIVYLHGGSGKGDDLELITAVDGFPKYLRGG